MKNNRLLLFLIFLFPASILSGTPQNGISDEIRQVVDDDGEFVRYFFTEEMPEYIPDTSFKDAIFERYEMLPLEMGVEVYFTYSLPEKYINDPKADIALYNILHRISSMEGIEYYSASRKRMRTFFAQAYAIESYENPVPVNDPVFSDIPAFDILPIFQEDLTFGKNISQAYYEYSDGICTMTVVNQTTMKYVIPVIPEGGLVMSMQIIPVGDELYFYGVCGVDMISLFGIERKKKESFYNRLKAMYNWFTGEIEKEYS